VLGLAIALLLISAGTALAVDPDVPAQLGESPLFSVPSALGELSYVPGRGLRLGATGLVVGGFTNIKAENTVASGAEFAIDSLNVFLIFDRYPRFRAVAELEFDDIFVASKSQTGTQDFGFDVRRLFGDFTIDDALSVRAGTYLTPVGYWNLILAPPLTWTTEPPLIVDKTFFQPTTTGVMLYGSRGLAGGQFGYSVFSQLLHPLENDPDLNPPDYAAGLRLTYDHGPSWSLGATYQGAESDSGWSQLGAFNVLWEHSRGEILSELYVQGGEALSSTQWGTYVQGVLEVYDPFFLVGRYEHYAPPEPQQALNLFTIGAVVHPLPFMAVKVEYRFADHFFEDESQEGLFASFTTFF
jgi:hypothetical protein